MAAKEIIVVRSLTDSDFGLFAAHRGGMVSKQRAIAIVASVARKMLSPELYDSGGAMFECSVVFGGETIRSQRMLSKTGKNWRLGGKKIEGAAFATLDSKDFVLIHSVASNEGSVPLSITFIGRNKDRVAHAGLAAFVGRQLESSMVVFDEGSDGFQALKPYCQTDHVQPAPRPKAVKKPKSPPPPIAPMPRERSSTARAKKPAHS